MTERARLALLLVGCERGGVAHHYRFGRVTAGSLARVQVGHDHYYYLDEDGEQYVTAQVVGR